MTKLLEQAVEIARTLPPDLQDAFAASLLADIDGELRWEAALDETGESLAALADEARAEDRAGRTEPLDPDTL